MTQIIEREYTTATTLAAGTFTEADIGRLFLNRADGEVFRCVAATPKFVHAYSLSQSQYTITYAATVTPNMLNGPLQAVTLTGNVTLALPTNGVKGSRLLLRIIQDGTGNRTITFNASYVLTGGNPTESTAASKVDLLDVTYNGSVWQGNLHVNVAAAG